MDSNNNIEKISNAFLFYGEYDELPSQPEDDSVDNKFSDGDVIKCKNSLYVYASECGWEKISNVPKIISFEGTDGSGKHTQAKLLESKLIELGYKVKLISFPMYDNESSCFVKNYLRGEYNKLLPINKYGKSLFFALDRYVSFITDWGEAISNYDIVIFDRYVGSNIIYQGSNLNDADLLHFINWVEDFEYNKLGLPIPDITFFLDVNYLVNKHMRQSRGGNADIHESDEDLMHTSYVTVNKVCDICKWKKIICSDGNTLKSENAIHEMIISELKTNNLIS